KQDEMMRICVDYRALNKATGKNKYPVSLVQDLMDRLSKACWFTKLDLGSGYWQVTIEEGDEPKTTKNKVRMDPKKVQAIVNWQEPRNVKDHFLSWLTFTRNSLLVIQKGQRL
uniref:Reverse transcriptase domain-containing protein n=1 Tax=Solanum lycopersicum TaxID=4081 RepID=A0A3Q7G4I1_SOLLC